MNFLKNLKISAKLASAFGVLIIILLVVSGLTLNRLSYIEDRTNWTEHTYNVLGELNGLTKAMINMETGVRGYLVSDNDTNFLEPYNAGLVAFDKHFKTVKRLTSDNPGQQKRLDDINKLAKTWINEIAKREISLMSNPATWAQARALEASGAGKTSMDATRAKIDEAARIERELLVARSTEMHQAFTDTSNNTIIGSVISVLIAMFMVFTLYRAIARPVKEVTDSMLVLAKGETSVEIPEVQSADEIGDMIETVHVFRENAIQSKNLEDKIKEDSALSESILTAISRAQAVIEFNLDGSIITANENFCGAMGYTLEEIQGKHHSMFADPEYAAGHEYKEFWAKLNRGEFFAGQYRRLGKGGKEVWIEASYNPIFDASGNALKVVKFATDITKSRQEADFNFRIMQATKGAKANIMLADLNYDIVYMNETMISMMKNAEADLKTELKDFDTDNLMGANIDVFHKNPDHQRKLLAKLTDTFDTTIVVGGRTFNLIAIPIFDYQGDRIGTSVEWSDMTDEFAIEEEIKTVVNASVSGDFSKRLETDGLDGFFLNVANGINMFAETTSNGLNDFSVMMNAMSSGDLNYRITNEYLGLFDELKQAANASSEKLAETLSRVILTANEVSNASTEIASGSADLSQRTEEQASSLEETAAAMEEMATAVKTNAENAQEANNLGKSARTVAEKGGEVVNSAVDAMDRIEDSSQKISDIIVVIDEIAFQTNLLALNAAVEAARAGDAGKGFAVVASEVRALAQRSAEAAKDIKALIADSTSQVKDGVSLVNEAGGQLNEIVTSIGQVTGLLADIANANAEQSSGIEEINKAVSEMDEATQQNSALVEETAASAQAMTDQSEEMRDMVSFFKVGEGQQSGSRTKSRSSASSNAQSSAASSMADVDSSEDDWAEF
ncbi:methyl-accepting chemotaxis protein [Temperatibacter marinus]|uniref:Methyl-accepting chemotaxis protein n=1 Tax=Temperatibacter marinus TaxID=1456591 RepID=A0AA52EC69_9PROT|nr:methyl-accepting chemotaxis protein [Temperatibacter marinus]WND02101.1 methyl-accepting chemotaxis protein [Temperatibacter marinus]